MRRAPSHRAVGRGLGPAAAASRAGGRGRGDRRRDRRGRRRRARAAPARRHRLGQDRGLPGGGRGGARPGPGGDRPRPRDRPRAAGRGPLPGPARRPRRGPALGPLRRRALRRVAAAARRRGERLRRAPLGGLRAGRRPRPARHRRGARPLLQAGGRPLLRRPRGRPPPGARVRRGAGRRHGDAAARRPGSSCRGWSCRAGSTGGRCRRSRSSTCAPPTRARGPLHPATLEALGEVRARGQQGDRDDQPARLLALAHLPLLRPPLGLPQLRRLADRPPPQRPPRLPPLRPLRAAARGLRRVRLDDAGSRAGAGTEQIEALLAERLAPMPVFRLDSDTTAGKGAHAAHPRRASARPRAPSWSAPRWSPRATTSPRSP